MSLLSIAVVLSIFAFLLFAVGFAKIDKKIGLWTIIILLFAFVLSASTTSSSNWQPPRTHPSYILGEYNL